MVWLLSNLHERGVISRGKNAGFHQLKGRYCRLRQGLQYWRRALPCSSSARIVRRVALKLSQTRALTSLKMTSASCSFSAARVVLNLLSSALSPGFHALASRLACCASWSARKAVLYSAVGFFESCIELSGVNVKLAHGVFSFPLQLTSQHSIKKRIAGLTVLCFFPSALPRTSQWSRPGRTRHDLRKDRGGQVRRLPSSILRLSTLSRMTFCRMVL